MNHLKLCNNACSVCHVNHYSLFFFIIIYNLSDNRYYFIKISASVNWIWWWITFNESINLMVSQLPNQFLINSQYIQLVSGLLLVTKTANISYLLFLYICSIIGYPSNITTWNWNNRSIQINSDIHKGITIHNIYMVRYSNLNGLMKVTVPLRLTPGCHVGIFFCLWH